jgi:hypothetical protein
MRGQEEDDRRSLIEPRDDSRRPVNLDFRSQMKEYEYPIQTDLPRLDRLVVEWRGRHFSLPYLCREGTGGPSLLFVHGLGGEGELLGRLPESGFGRLHPGHFRSARHRSRAAPGRDIGLPIWRLFLYGEANKVLSYLPELRASDVRVREIASSADFRVKQQGFQ